MKSLNLFVNAFEYSLVYFLMDLLVEEPLPGANNNPIAVPAAIPATIPISAFPVFIIVCLMIYCTVILKDPSSLNDPEYYCYHRNNK